VPDRTLGTVRVPADDENAAAAREGEGGSFALPVVEEMAESASQTASVDEGEPGPGPEPEGGKQERKQERGQEMRLEKAPVAVNGAAFEARVVGSPVK
jgi:hypothetical protein